VKYKAGILAALFVAYATVSSYATVISAVNTGSSSLQDNSNTVLETTPQTISFNAGATADALIVALSSESNATAGQVSITYNGVPLSPVIDQLGSVPSIWFLNDPYTGGSANLVLDMTNVDTANGYGLGIVSVSAGGLDIQVSDSNSAAAQSVSLNTTAESSFVVAGHRANSASGSASALTPLTQLYGAQIGSSQGSAGYDADVAAGNPTFSFSGSTNGPQSSAAAFTAIPEPASLAILGLGGLLIARRRNR